MPSFDRRGFLTLAGAATTSALATACSGSSLGAENASSGDGPVKIGLIIPSAGVYKALGEEMQRGWELFTELNGGKVGGRRVDVVVVDEGDGQKTETAVANAKKLIKRDKVVAACGIMSSTSLLAVQDLFTDAKIPMISTNASPTGVQGKAFGWRTSYVNEHPSIAIGPYLAKRAGGPITVIAPDYAAGHDHVEGIQKTFKPAGGKLAGEPILTPFPIGGKSFQPYLQQIEQQNPSAVYTFFAGADAVKFIKEYDKFGLRDKYPLYATGYTTEGPVLKAMGEAAKGIRNVMHYAPDLDNAANRRFVAEYQKKYGEAPSIFPLAMYDAGWVLDQAIAKLRDDLTSENLDKAIGDVGQIDSPRGSWTFGKNRSPVQKWYLREVKKDGDVLANVVIDELATLGDEA